MEWHLGHVNSKIMLWTLVVVILLAFKWLLLDVDKYTVFYSWGTWNCDPFRSILNHFVSQNKDSITIRQKIMCPFNRSAKRWSLCCPFSIEGRWLEKVQSSWRLQSPVTLFNHTFNKYDIMHFHSVVWVLTSRTAVWITKRKTSYVGRYVVAAKSIRSRQIDWNTNGR